MATTVGAHGQFIQETFRLLKSTLGVSRAAYYRVDARRDLRDFVFAAVPSEFHLNYEREMFALDPLHIRRLEPHGVGVAHLADAHRYAP